MIVLDTTVLVYAVGAEHPLREPARRIVRAIHDASVHATTSSAVIQEFAHVFARRRSREQAAAIARDHATLLAPLLAVEPRHVDAGLDIFERNPGLTAFDSFLVAATISAGADALVSGDRAFAAVQGLPFVDLADSTELDRLLA